MQILGTPQSTPHHISANGKLFAPETGTSPDTASRTNLEQKEEKRVGADSKLSSSDLQIVEQLKTRDREVRAHEAAHLAAAGSLATRGATYSYQQGPDGQSYAIGGEVGIDISPVSGDPAATLSKAETVRRAALAPANPSGQDFMVAQAAGAMAQQARTELLHLNQQKAQHYAKHLEQEPADKKPSTIHISA